MKWMFGLVASSCLMGWAPTALADGCFLCEGGGYVAFKGDDTFDKRKKAKEQFSCNVVGTKSSCSKPKGTVSYRLPVTAGESLVCQAPSTEWTATL